MYAEIVTEFYTLFNNTSFSIPFVPRDYFGPVGDGDEFFSVQVMYPQGELARYNGGKKIDGYVIVDVFTEAGKGDLRSAQLVDELDTVLQAKRISEKIETFTSNVTDLGKDSDNSSLRRTEYRINFTYHGDI